MACTKCNYSDKSNVKINDLEFCSICSAFTPTDPDKLNDYLNEKLDWKLLETFRKYGQKKGKKQKSGMSKVASEGKIVTRAPLGYSVFNGRLIANEDSSRVHSLFKTFLSRDYSLNSLAKNFSLSVNGVKKILSNRTYLGEVKFDGQIHKGNHKPIISAEIFYAVQRKLKTYLKPRKKTS